MTNLETLKERNFVYQTTDDNSLQQLLNQKLTFYTGFDPTADSLHVGHLLPIMLARFLAKKGHQPIILIGGATALIGDPSGKKEARKILSKETVEHNSSNIQKQLQALLSIPNSPSPIFVNNFDWLSKITVLDFLREYGSKFSVNKMLTAESVKQRIETTGISYLEFSYVILQACDFLHLFENYNCTLQIGGQDQWGNIIAGIDIIRRFKSAQTYGLTTPLLLSPSGEKFGKTAEGAVWLDETKTSNFDYYQFWRNTPDSQCGEMLKLFTELPEDEIAQLEKLQPPALNRAKEILAYECTKIVRGEDAAKNAYLAAGFKFGFADPENKIPTSSSIKNILTDKSQNTLPVAKIAKPQNEDSIWIIKLFHESGLCSSNSEARRLIQNGGAYLNGEKISDPNIKIPIENFINQQIIISAGKKNFKKIILE